MVKTRPEAILESMLLKGPNPAAFRAAVNLIVSFFKPILFPIAYVHL